MEYKNGFVSGYWLQDHVGTLESAKEVARQTKKANNNKIDISVVEQINSTVPGLSYYTNLKSL